MPINDMNKDRDGDLLRRLAAEDPREARALVNSMIDGQTDRLDSLIATFRAPGDGRVRQLIANVVRTRPDASTLSGKLNSWLDKEIDEFARNAIIAALQEAARANPGA